MTRTVRGAARAEASPLRSGGVALSAVLPALRAVEPFARACWVYDLDAFETRARRFLAAFSELDPLVAYALKANALPALLERARALKLLAEAGSVGELEIARVAGYAPGALVLNGNGRTPEEADWAARRGVALVNADHLGELDLLEHAASGAGTRLRVALRVNPAIRTRGASLRGHRWARRKIRHRAERSTRGVVGARTLAASHPGCDSRARRLAARDHRAARSGARRSRSSWRRNPRAAARRSRS